MHSRKEVLYKIIQENINFVEFLRRRRKKKSQITTTITTTTNTIDFNLRVRFAKFAPHGDQSEFSISSQFSHIIIFTIMLFYLVI